MNSKAPVVILIILCLGLLGGLVVRHNKARDETRTNLERIRQISNEWATARAKLDDLESVNTSLRTDRDSTRSRLDLASTQLTQARDSLSLVERKVEEATKALQERALEIVRLETRAKELENQKNELDQRTAEMKGAIGTLETRIAETQQRLGVAEGDRDILLAELLRLQTEKSNLERRLSDVVALKEQIVNLREQLSLTRRLETLRKSLHGPDQRKGDPASLRGVRPDAPQTRPDLDVEVRRSGATVVPPAPADDKK